MPDPIRNPSEVPGSFVAFDIETSGLTAKKGDFLTCIGLSSELGIKQFSAPHNLFNASPLVAENIIINDFLNFMRNAWIEPHTTLISYNGSAFDFPFIEERIRVHQEELEQLTDQDILLQIDRELSRHYDLRDFCASHCRGGTYIKKDTAASQLCDMYVPGSPSGLFFARKYKTGNVTRDDHVKMLQHNAIDLGVTLRMATNLLQYPDFREHIDSNTNPVKLFTLDVSSLESVSKEVSL